MKKFLTVALAAILLLTLSVAVFAAGSPEGTKKIEVTIRDGVGADPVEKVIDAGESITVKVDDDKKADFSSWSIYKPDGSPAKEGKDFKFAKGSSFDTATLEIIPLTNVIIAANYDGVITDPLTGEKGDPISPETGDLIVMGLGALAAAALASGCIAGKKAK